MILTTVLVSTIGISKIRGYSKLTEKQSNFDIVVDYYENRFPRIKKK